MNRSNQFIYPQRIPTELRDATTILFLRDTHSIGFEVLMTRRSTNASFAPGVFVFPGGCIETLDFNGHAHCISRPNQSQLELTQATSAIRESFEELGILLAEDSQGQPAKAQDIEVMNRSTNFLEQCNEKGLRLSAHKIFELAHWTTDRDLPKRFSVTFLVARIPSEQTAIADENEQFEPVWMTPRLALEQYRQGVFPLIFPTIRTLERLCSYTDAQAVFDSCSAVVGPLWKSCPRAGWLAGKEARYMEDEAPFGELELVCPDGQLLHKLDWQSQTIVQLRKNISRLTAPNPGVMTGPGTNTYIVGDPETGFIVIDPGPDESSHIKALWQFTGGDIRAIVCTHSHPDHSPGAKPLQALCVNQPPVLGLPSAQTARLNSSFKPDREINDGERLLLKDKNQETLHTLQIIHTPGHAANHLCLILEEDSMLFSGDHILNGSTTVIDPPDGDMDDYLKSLDLLSQACSKYSIRFIFPAHGYVLGNAEQAISNLKKHRLKREAKIIRVMKNHLLGTLDEWVKEAYDDVPSKLWPVAKRSLMAHVERIELLGLIENSPYEQL